MLRSGSLLRSLEKLTSSGALPPVGSAVASAVGGRLPPGT